MTVTAVPDFLGSSIRLLGPIANLPSLRVEFINSSSHIFFNDGKTKCYNLGNLIKCCRFISTVTTECINQALKNITFWKCHLWVMLQGCNFIADTGECPSFRRKVKCTKNVGWQKDKYCMISLIWGTWVVRKFFLVVKFIETKSRTVVTRDWGEKLWGVIF